MKVWEYVRAYFKHYSIEQYRKPNMDLSKIKFVKSPNYSKRTDQVRCIILHHTGSTNFNGTVKWLCDKQASASAHYVVGTSGEVNQLVGLENASWNAGKSEWVLDGQKRIGLNGCSIGIEIINIGILIKGQDGKFYYEVGRELKEWKGETPTLSSITYPNGTKIEGYTVAYPQIQTDAVIDLCKSLLVQYPNINKDGILTHYQVATPAGRKNDPFGLDVELIKQKIFE